MSRSTFAQNLAIRRRELGYTQAIMADMIGVTVPAYQAYEESRAEPPISRYFRICYVLQVDDLVLFHSELTQSGGKRPELEGVMMAWLELQAEKAL